MASSADARVPAHLWIVGLIALLWNGYGCYDYLMTVTANQAYLAQFPPDALAYFNSLPAWTTAMWAFGVWGGLVGAILLLMRNRLATWAFMLSMVGAIVGLGYQMFVQPMPASLTAGPMKYMPWLIILVTVLLVVYSRNQEKKGVVH